jgi:hypothetical protein
MFLAALVAGHALAYAPPAYPVEPPCGCQRRVEPRYEEVHLDNSFFYSGGGVGMNYSAPVYGGGGVMVISGGASAAAGAGAAARASASVAASVSASVSANISVRYGGGGGGCGGGCGGGGKPHGGYGGKH